MFIRLQVLCDVTVGGSGRTHRHCGCSCLANGEYLHRHNQVARIIHQQLALKYKLVDSEVPYYKYVPDPVLKKGHVTLYWDRSIITDRTIVAEYVPEPIMVDQQENLPEDFNKKELEGNTVVSPEIVPEAAHNVVPEVLSHKQANELTKVINNELASAHDKITEDSATDGSAPIVNEDIPVTTDTVKDTQHNCVGIIRTEPVIQDNEKQTINTNVPISETADIKTLDDEIIVSENTSPFVSVTAEDIPGVQSEENIDVQNIDHRLVTDGKIVLTPPASPPIASKGYNFNFDEMDDPFATKTKIRISPPLDTPTKVVETKMSSKSAEKPVVKKEMINRRKSQPERKKPVASKRKFNSTYSGAVL